MTFKQRWRRWWLRGVPVVWPHSDHLRHDVGLPSAEPRRNLDGPY